MRKKFVLVGLLAALAGCSTGGEPLPLYVEHQLGYAPWLAVVAATPPVNQMLFGPCKEEFGMPDSKRDQCNFYYRVVERKPAPWNQREADAQAAIYAPGELRCWRTLGSVAECEVVGPLRKPSQLVAPTNLNAE
jgi:hypothetical protein